MGYYRAGFTEIVGIDIKPQPRYPFAFVQADALRLPFALDCFDAIHASPPCQAFTDLKDMHNAKDHPDLLSPTREMLKHIGLPFVIENVPGAPLGRGSLLLCGTMFGLSASDASLWRHRYFETNFALPLTPPCNHRKGRVIGVYDGGHGRDRRRKTNTQDFSVEDRRAAMGIEWMSGMELSQAIPLLTHSSLVTSF